MKATSGNLRLNQSYKIIDTEYRGKFINSFDALQCQNCGLLITNIAIVEGSEDKIKYSIGLDCAATLTSINACELAEAKKKLARRARFMKFLKTEAKSIVIGVKGTAWIYKSIVEKWASYWVYRVDAEFNMAVLKASGLPIIFDKE